MVEILIVVVIVGILAAVVLPQLSTAGVCARANMLAEDLRTTRSQIFLFKWRHNGVPPGYPGLNRSAEPDADTFTAHMTQATTLNGAVAAPGTPGYPYGPYLTKVPVNPVNGKSTIQILSAAQAVVAMAKKLGESR